MSKWDLYNAARSYSSKLADEVGVSAAGRKRFVEQNTRFILNDCKRNSFIKQVISDKYENRSGQSSNSQRKKPAYDYTKQYDCDNRGHIKGHYVDGRFEPY